MGDKLCPIISEATRPVYCRRDCEAWDERTRHCVMIWKDYREGRR